MSQPNGDPSPFSFTPQDDPSASSEPSPGDPTPAPASGPSPLPPTPRANPPSVFNPRDVPPPAAAPGLGFNDFLVWMQSRASEQPPAPPAAAQRTQLPKERKKFQRADSEAKADKKIAPPSNMAPGAAGDAASVVRKRRKIATAGESRDLQRLLLPSLILLVLLYASFKLGRSTAPKPVVATSAPLAKTSQEKEEPQAGHVAELIDQAMTAESKADFIGAMDLLQQAQSLSSHVAGINYHLALLAFENNDLPRAMTLLDHCIDKADDLAAAYNLRGTLINRTGGINRGLDNLESATRIDPFNARYFFFLGEALRRAGKPQLALVRLREAVDRLREPSLDGLYNLKIRLTQIELGQENEFTSQLATELSRTPPAIDWLFTATALEMRRGHLDVAAMYLDKALTLNDPQTVSARLRDYYFFAFAHEKPLARFFEANNSPEAARESAAAVAPANPPTALDLPVPPEVAPSPAPGASQKP